MSHPDLSKNDRLSVEHLVQVLLGEDCDLDTIAVADTLWLATQMGQVEGSRVTKNQPVSEQPEIEADRSEVTSSSMVDEPKIPVSEAASNQPAADLTLPPSKEDRSNYSSDTGLSISVPKAPSLRHGLELGRSLRPLKRRVPSARHQVLDEEATAVRIAESRSAQTQVWVPVMVPEPEYWLDVAIVVEESRSSFIWRELIDEFRVLLERQGAFRDVRAWHLEYVEKSGSEGWGLRSWDGASRKLHRPEILQEPRGRRLVLVVSDGVSGYWRDNVIQPLLKEWSRQLPVTLVQLLPERFWQRTALAFGYRSQLQSFVPGSPSDKLEVTDLPLWLDLDKEKRIKQQSLKLPVVTLEPESLRYWAMMMTGRGGATIDGVLFDPSRVRSVSDEDGDEVDIEQRIEQFWLTASPLAQRLARFMSAAPVSLPVVHVIQQALLTESWQVHVAEVFMSGLVTRVPGSEPAEYDFLPGVRDALGRATPQSKSLDVLNAVSKYFAERAGLAVQGFEALLTMQEDGIRTVGEVIRPFATIVPEVLRRMGGKYTAWADRLEQVRNQQTITHQPAGIISPISGPDIVDEVMDLDTSIGCTCILFLAANPKGTEALEIDREVLEIRVGMERSRNRSEYRSEYRPVVTWEEMRRAIMDVQPQIVHVLGHGEKGKRLIFEGMDGPEAVKKSLKQLFEVFPVECVVLSACYSETEAAQIHQYVRCVIGMSQSIADQSAREFALGFYQGLLEENGYEWAFGYGKGRISSQIGRVQPSLLIRDKVRTVVDLELPGGIVPIASPFYIERPTVEEDVCRLIRQPGGLLRIKAPREFGKSSLVARVADSMKSERAEWVAVNFWEIDREYLISLDTFLQWFCKLVSRKLRLENQVDKYWGHGLGSKGTCSDYFEDYLLPQVEGALVLELDEVDCLFDERIAPGGWAIDFFNVLRAWNEKGANSTQWKKLRLVLLYSQDVTQKTINQLQSPFNVGRVIRLPELNQSQVMELVRRHELDEAETIAQQVMNLVGGHPHLVRVLLYTMVVWGQSLRSLLVDGTIKAGLCGEHLQRQRIRLGLDQEAMGDFRRVLTGEAEVAIPARSREVLESLGLVKSDRNGVRVSCKLYRNYFSDLAPMNARPMVNRKGTNQSDLLEYCVGGSLPLEAVSYVTRQADEEFYTSLKVGEFCYVLAPRQVGKSSLRVRTMRRLQDEGSVCVLIDMVALGPTEMTADNFYAVLLWMVVRQVKAQTAVLGDWNVSTLRAWWQERDQLPFAERWGEFMKEVLLAQVSQQVVIFVDEIDSVLAFPFRVDDFFAAIRESYRLRVKQPIYQRLTVALLGVCAPPDLIQDRRKTPFNIGRSIELPGFTFKEAKGLSVGLPNGEATLREVLAWTGGQPFLTQRLCRLVCEGKGARGADEIVWRSIIEAWESSDEQVHFQTIQDRLMSNDTIATELLELYQRILREDGVVWDRSTTQLALQLTGLVGRMGDRLVVSNRIYSQIFNLDWTVKKLSELARPGAN